MSRVWKELGGYDRDSKYAAISKYEAKVLLQRKKPIKSWQ